MNLPKHYYDVLKDYYFLVHPPKETSELDESGLGNGAKVVDFDKLTTHRRSLMKGDWDRNTVKGDPV